MGTRRLFEADAQMIENHIRANIGTALAGVSTDTADGSVSLEVPQKYFWYARPLGLELPAVLIIARTMDLRKRESGPNFIDGLSSIDVSVTVEDRSGDRLVLKAFRYMNALHEVLDLTQLTSGDGKVKLFLKVMRLENSSVYMNTDTIQEDTVFRKEVMLSLDVEHVENF